MIDTLTNPKVDEFITQAEKWREEFSKLRAILLGSGLTEDFKWGVPCYTLKGKNIALIHGFKEYCAVLFVKGALLKDERGILIRQTENVQAARQARFTSLREIDAAEAALKETIAEAIRVEESGLEVPFKKSAEFSVPEELQAKFGENPDLKTAFAALTPGRQRAYLLYFSQPKQAATRQSRVEKYIPQILNGKGLDD
jgi:uncharacterized protein YdeI (YjbR/CyaY-like superfamily)